jgi:acetylornithine deacetylase/succinyl-diaminopimelate desuccinylase-like protein
MERTDGVGRLEAAPTSPSPPAPAGRGSTAWGRIGGLDHDPDEHILRSSIVPRTALLARLLAAIEAERQRGNGDG